MAGNKNTHFLTEFECTPKGCSEARDFLLGLEKWSDDVHRRDGWEIVGIANKELRKHNEQEWEPYDDI